MSFVCGSDRLYEQVRAGAEWVQSLNAAGRSPFETPMIVTVVEYNPIRTKQSISDQNKSRRSYTYHSAVIITGINYMCSRE